MYNNYVCNGVIITPNVIAEGDTVNVLYKGLLKNGGADRIYLHTGYGDSWEGSKDIQMSKTREGFEASLPINSYNKLNIAFKDGADHWDNNSGKNYSFEVQR